MGDTLTAADLIERLKQIPGDTAITYTKWDSEYMWNYRYGIADVAENGSLRIGNILESWSDWDEDYDIAEGGDD